MSEQSGKQAELIARELAERDAQMEAVRVISAALCQVTKVNELVERALDVSLECVGAEAGSVILHDIDKDKLVFKYVVGEAADDLTGMEMEPDQGLAGAVFQNGEIDVSDDVTASTKHDRRVGEQVDYVTKNMVTVPLMSVEGRAIGVMQVLNKTEGVFDQSDVAILDILASQIAAGLETARLNEEARLAEVVRFIGNLSHDVKNMMTPVQTAAETLEFVADDTWTDFDGACERLGDSGGETVSDAVLSLRDLLPELTAMMKSGCDAVQMRMAEVSAAVKGMVTEPSFHEDDINMVIDQVVPMLAIVAEKENVTIEKDVSEDIGLAIMDVKQMYNAIYNLVNNALQACPEGAKIIVHSHTVQDGEFPDGAYLEVAVEDTGEGMPEEVRRKLFTDDAVSTKPMGTGLGTKIVKNVVDVHGGQVWVESVQGEGTTISFRIPIAGSPEALEMMREAEKLAELEEER